MVRTRLFRVLSALLPAISALVALQSPASAAPATDSGPWVIWGYTSSKCVDNPNSSTAVIQMDIYSCVQGAHNEQWTFQPLDDGYVLIRNVSSTKCLTVENNGTDNNIPVLQYQCLLNYNAEWLPEKTNPEQVDWYQLRNRHSGKCLTVKGASSANNAKLLQYTCDPEQGNNQWSWANPSSGNIPYV